MGLKQMMEKLGVPKTHLDVKKMIVEVTGGSSNTINYVKDVCSLWKCGLCRVLHARGG